MKRVWNEKMDNLLRRHYPKGDLHVLAERLGVSYGAVKSRASKLGIVRKVNMHRPWTQRQLDYLQRHYADMPMSELKRRTGHAEKSIWQRAAAMGLRKSQEFLRECGRRTAQCPNSIATRFQKGLVPWNKGKRDYEFRSKDAIARCAKTQFKPGHRPANAKPVGYERINDDGYILVKVSMDCKMVLKHRWVYEQAYGAIPEGYNIMFRDGNKLNCSLDNLELVSRGEAARRQVKAETPEQRRKRVERMVVSRNKTIRMDKIRLHWGMEPKSKLVKRW